MRSLKLPAIGNHWLKSSIRPFTLQNTRVVYFVYNFFSLWRNRRGDLVWRVIGSIRRNYGRSSFNICIIHNFHRRFDCRILGDIYSQVQRSIGASERMLEILDQGDESNSSHRSLRLTGAIAYDNVEFSYPTRSDITVLKSISLRIRPGEKVALVGPSGSGKSTIVSLLMRFYPLDKGNIIVDGNDISTYGLSAYRENIGIVPQEVILFGGTIRENIAYGNPLATQQEVFEAARQANALEFIESFPEKFETLVGDRGVKLSGGQRQRIAIARAILKNPSILILDEATSSLDARSEQLVQQALEKLMENRTTIVIAHRLSTIRKADRILVIKDGEIAESGTHEELSILNNGIYRNLLMLQWEKQS